MNKKLEILKKIAIGIKKLKQTKKANFGEKQLLIKFFGVFVTFFFVMLSIRFLYLVY